MTVSFCGLQLAHPVINGSGTFDAIAARAVFGPALGDEFPFAAYVSKTITLEPREGNPPPRLWEAPGGLINSIGLPNKGLAAYLELNVSCPNVATGLDIGAAPATLEEVVGATRARTAKPLIVKLTPNTADVVACAQAAEAGGADAVSLINTLRAMALAPGRGARPWLGGGTGGLSGPAVRAVALAQVAAVAAEVAIPVVGMGGVQSAAHARALIDVGATLVAVGTENFCDPTVGARIARELGETAPGSQSRA